MSGSWMTSCRKRLFSPAVSSWSGGRFSRQSGCFLRISFSIRKTWIFVSALVARVFG